MSSSSNQLNGPANTSDVSIRYCRWRRFWSWSIGSVLGCTLSGVWLDPFLLLNLGMISALLLMALICPDDQPRNI